MLETEGIRLLTSAATALREGFDNPSRNSSYLRAPLQLLKGNTDGAILNHTAILAGAVWLALLGLALSAGAVPFRINVGGIDYDVTTLTTTADAGRAVHESQPWFQSESMASAFASAVGDGLGLPNFFPLNNNSDSPLFAYGFIEFSDGPYVVVSPNRGFYGLASYTFAITSPIAAPDSGSTLFLLGAPVLLFLA